MRIIVLGYIVRGPLGGMVWHHLQYVLGLRRLGHDVYFVEDSDDYESCFNPVRCAMTANPDFGLQFACESFRKVGLGDRWAYFDAHQNRWIGPKGAEAVELFRSADVLLNVSGVNPIRDWTVLPPVRVLIDTDPVFTQARHLRKPAALRDARAHTAFFSFGENVGAPDCAIPDDGLPWRPTRQPMVLDAWMVEPGDPTARFTTVMQWDSYPALECGGRTFGMKSASFGPYLDLPGRTSERLELALGSASAPRDDLRRRGWAVADPLAITRTAASYQRYISSSKGEFSVAKHGYVASRSGWFSERSAGYLASGRPVVTQDTGFTNWLETDGGVLAFDSPEGAVDALRRVAADYRTHCRKARAAAKEHFHAGAVLGSLLDRAA
jgi:hypothetical protein